MSLDAIVALKELDPFAGIIPADKRSGPSVPGQYPSRRSFQGEEFSTRTRGAGAGQGLWAFCACPESRVERAISGLRAASPYIARTQPAKQVRYLKRRLETEGYAVAIGGSVGALWQVVLVQGGRGSAPSYACNIMCSKALLRFAGTHGMLVQHAAALCGGHVDQLRHVMYKSFVNNILSRLSSGSGR